MADRMTPRQRMIAAKSGKMPDRVPVSPDTSIMLPTKMTGKPFWDLDFYEDPPLWKAYLEFIKKYGIDGWFWYVGLEAHPDDPARGRKEIVARTEDTMTVRTTMETPEGELWSETVHRRDNPAAVTRGFIKDLEKDFKCLPYLYPDIDKMTDDRFQTMRQEVGEYGIVGIGVGIPRLMYTLRDGGLEAAAYDYYDHYKLVKEFCEWEGDWFLRYCNRALAARPDFIHTGGSGTLSMQSVPIFRDLGLPTLKKITRLCKEAGIPSHVHSCGKERELVRICYEETDLDSICPLEMPPAGDCNLAEIKRLYGHRLCLKGNVHTTDPMLIGTPADVREAVKRCIDVAADSGRFILSTGDQCGRDTPETNLLAFIEAGKDYGRY